MPQFSPHRGSLDAAAFDSAARKHPRMQPAALAAARAVLVDGKPIPETATTHGVSKQRVSAVVGRLAAQEPPPAVPEGWMTGVVSLPPALMAQVRELEAQARQALAR